MKAKKILQILNISRATLCRYVKTGAIKATLKESGDYEYDTESVYTLKNNGKKRRRAVYGRSRMELNYFDQFQLMHLEDVSVYCDNGEYGLDGRNEFLRLVKDIIAGKVSEVNVVYKDSLPPETFDFFSKLMEGMDCTIKVHVQKTGEEEKHKSIMGLIEHASQLITGGDLA